MYALFRVYFHNFHIISNVIITDKNTINVESQSQEYVFCIYYETFEH
jgi:hypothetical protein